MWHWSQNGPCPLCPVVLAARPAAHRGQPTQASMSELDHIAVRGAEEHNLKRVDLDLPKKKLVVFTGPSGSGKSSMAFDTIYAEGQRRYVESLSAYARQFLGQLEKPKYESIRGLSPTIAIEQKSASKNPRSTVGTITEILDYLRVLWARIGVPRCAQWGQQVGNRTQDEIVDGIMVLPADSRILLLAPKVADRKGEHQDVLDKAKKTGFTRVRADGQEFMLDQPNAGPVLNKKVKHRIEIVVDRLVIKDGIRQRLADSVETALREGEGKLLVAFADKGSDVRRPTSDVPPTKAKRAKGEPAEAHEASDIGPRTSDLFFSEHLYCNTCDLSFPDLEPNSFSFNSPLGACPDCNGLGAKTTVDLDKLIVPTLTINEGAVAAWGALGDEDRQAWHVEYRRDLLDKLKVDLDTPWKKLGEKQRQLVLYGHTERVAVNWSTTNGSGTFNTKFDGVIPWLERTLKESDSDWRRDKLGQYFSSAVCPSCHGSRIKPTSAAVKLGGQSLTEVCHLTIGQAGTFFSQL